MVVPGERSVMATRMEQERALMPPPPSRTSVSTARHHKPLIALEEDEYQTQMSAIIERDFFPELPKLQNQLEWLQAGNSGDPLAIRKAQLNIAFRRAGLKTPLGPGIGAPAAATPGTWATPATNLLRTPAMTPFVAMTPQPLGPGPSLLHPHSQQQQQHGGNTSTSQAAPSDTPNMDPYSIPVHRTSNQQQQQQGQGEVRAPPLRLDAFFSAFTSEDNASFHALEQREETRKRAKFAHHLNDKNEYVTTAMALLAAGPHPSDGFGTSGQAPMTLDPIRYEPLNALYYFRDNLPLSAAEIAMQTVGGDKSVHPSNTRFNSGSSEAAAAAAAEAAEDRYQAAAAAAAALHGGAINLNHPVAPSQHGNLPPPSYLATPSMTPGRDASPFMTWGDIESTPLRLDAVMMEGGLTLDASGVVGGPAFKVGVPSKREQLGRDLAAKSASYPSAARAALARPSGLLESLRRISTPLLSCPGTGVPELSAAAQKLAAAVLLRSGGSASRSGGGVRSGQVGGGSSGGAGLLTDSQLRATYSAGKGTGGRSVTPSGTGHRVGGRAEGGRSVRTGGSSGAAGGGGGSWVTPLLGAAGKGGGRSAGGGTAGARHSAQASAMAGLSAQNLTDGLLDL